MIWYKYNTFYETVKEQPSKDFSVTKYLSYTSVKDKWHSWNGTNKPSRKSPWIHNVITHQNNKMFQKVN